jgi:hypothetical protein
LAGKLSAQHMDASRRDYFRQVRLLQKQLAVLLAAGLIVMWLLSHASSRWFELLCVLLLLVCSGGIFVVSAWLFTHHHPAISLFSDRLWFRGLREQVVMLRNVSDAELVESRVAGWTRRWIRLRLGDAGSGGADHDEVEQLRIPLDAVEGDPGEMIELIRERAALQREQAHVR